MDSLVRGLRAAVTALVLSTLVGTGVAAQNSRWASAPPIAMTTANSPQPLASCKDDVLPGLRIPQAVASSGDDLHSNCETPLGGAAAVDPCAGSISIPSGCRGLLDTPPPSLEMMGKGGWKVSRARQRVLEILENDNACSAWYQQKDLNPAATFRVIRFELDRKGEDAILESRDPGSPVIFRNPYVAKVIQGDGPNATITLNQNGAFFRTTARAMGVRKEGGPVDFRGQRTLRVGPYWGDSLQAQVVTLLHEFGHALDMLPADENDVDGKSARNTEEVLRHCRDEVEGKVNQSLLRASQ